MAGKIPSCYTRKTVRNGCAQTCEDDDQCVSNFCEAVDAHTAYCRPFTPHAKGENALGQWCAADDHCASRQCDVAGGTGCVGKTTVMGKVTSKTTVTGKVTSKTTATAKVTEEGSGTAKVTEERSSTGKVTASAGEPRRAPSAAPAPGVAAFRKELKEAVSDVDLFSDSWGAVWHATTGFHWIIGVLFLAAFIAGRRSAAPQ